ncbi:MAG: VOC family protein [Dehalococcoidales bacterium]|nr:VOC family protein [Dehalococcoidales bacterium]
MAAEPKYKVNSVNQIGFVVKDLDKSVEAYWRILGIGPWRMYTYQVPLVKDPMYKGKPENFRMRIALANVGDMMIELIEHLEGKTVYKDYAAKAGEGIQHLGIFIPNLAQAVKEAEAAGFEVIQTGHGHGTKGDGGFAYLDTEAELGTVFELIEIPSDRVPPERVYPE